jgi:hypothetical protein
MARDQQNAARLPFELSGEAVIAILGALASRKAAERNNLDLGPGSQRTVDQVERAERELLQQVPDDAKIQLGIRAIAGRR